VRRILDSGVDGIDIRTIGHHNCASSYLACAFAPSVREAFRARHGREVTATDADYELLRRLRGEAYTDFLRAARALASTGGQRFGAHLEWGVEVPPSCHTRLQLQMHLDWRTWITEGLLDDVSLRGWGCFSRFVHREILPLAHRHEVDVHVISANLPGGMDLRAMEIGPRLALEARAAGFAGYNLYETDCLMRMNAAGMPMPVGLVDKAVRRMRAALDGPR
jgi:hypothetical protein